MRNSDPTDDQEEQRFRFSLFAKFTLLALIIAIAGLATVPYSPAGSINNHDWNGTSIFAQQLREQLGLPVTRSLWSSIRLNEEPANQLIIIVGGQRKFSSQEVEAVKNYVDRGGAVLIFDNRGTGAQLLAKLGIMQLPGQVVSTSEAMQYLYPQNIIVPASYTIIGEFFPLEEDFPLVFPNSVGLVDTRLFTGQLIDYQTVPLAASTELSVLDVDTDYKIESSDFAGPIPIAWMRQIGNGLVAGIGTPSFVMNEVVQLKGFYNLFFAISMVQILMGLLELNSIVFDESHAILQFTALTGLIQAITGAWFYVSTMNIVFQFAISLIGVIFVIYALTAVKSRKKSSTKIALSGEGGKLRRYISMPEMILIDYYVNFSLNPSGTLVTSVMHMSKILSSIIREDLEFTQFQIKAQERNISAADIEEFYLLVNQKLPQLLRRYGRIHTTPIEAFSESKKSNGKT